MNAHKISLGFVLLAASAAAWSQNFWGAGPGGGGGATGVAGGWGVGPTVARVNVAPWGGAGGAWMGNAGPAAGGLHGVTRPMFMGEPNAVAAQFFGSGGVSGLPPASVPTTGRIPSAGLLWGQTRRTAPASLAAVPRRQNSAGPNGFAPPPAGYPLVAAARNVSQR